MNDQLWQVRPIFISSTFRDMHQERDHLHNFVFPALSEKLARYYQHLEPIDLRWGVATANISDVEEKEREVLKVCMDEIERSRPFLIAILGDRYGWVPPPESVKAVVGEKVFSKNLADRSVTDLEIFFGLSLGDNTQCRGFFYFRHPLPYEVMDLNLRQIYSDQYDANREPYVEKLKELKASIEKVVPDRVRRYELDWDSENNKVLRGLLWSCLSKADCSLLCRLVF